MIFTGEVVNGTLSPDVRRWIADYIRTFDGHEIDITVRKHREQRTLKQSAYLHAEAFPKLAAKWGESIERTKIICMGEFWGWEPCTVTKCFLPVKAHTSDMTVQECTTFIDWLIPWAAEKHGVQIRLPDEAV